MAPPVGAGPDLNTQMPRPSIADKFRRLTCFHNSGSDCDDAISWRCGMLMVYTDGLSTVGFSLYFEACCLVFCWICTRSKHMDAKTRKTDKFRLFTCFHESYGWSFMHGWLKCVPVIFFQIIGCFVKFESTLSQFFCSSSEINVP